MLFPTEPVRVWKKTVRYLKTFSMFSTHLGDSWNFSPHTFFGRLFAHSTGRTLDCRCYGSARLCCEYAHDQCWKRSDRIFEIWHLWFNKNLITRNANEPWDVVIRILKRILSAWSLECVKLFIYSFFSLVSSSSFTTCLLWPSWSSLFFEKKYFLTVKMLRMTGIMMGRYNGM